VMCDFTDVVEFFIKMVHALKANRVRLDSPLEQICAAVADENTFAYVDNRRDARDKYGFDFWAATKKRRKFKNDQEFERWIGKELKLKPYSKSEQFPDFLFRTRKCGNRLICGSLLELKDSKGGSIASFNSTLPTKCKSLEEVDIINGNNLVSRIAALVDADVSETHDYKTFNRRCFYLIRTHARDRSKVKVSIVDGSFFETIPKENLICQMFLNVLRRHLQQTSTKVSPQLPARVEQILRHVTDQTIIASSQDIDKASVRPRLRIMAEVHPEGNPHSSHYPEVFGRSVNLIMKKDDCGEVVGEMIRRRLSAIREFTILHKRNGEHVVFQYKF